MALGVFLLNQSCWCSDEYCSRKVTLCAFRLKDQLKRSVKNFTLQGLEDIMDTRYD